MIRAFEENDLSAIMQLWLDANIKAHSFITKEYWTANFEMVRNILPQAEVYVYENDASKQTDGFIGLSGDHIEGLFVREGARSNGIVKQLLEYVKRDKLNMSLYVYQNNIRAVQFYLREQFVIWTETINKNTNQNEYFMIWKK